MQFRHFPTGVGWDGRPITRSNSEKPAFSIAKPSGDYIPLGGSIFHRDSHLFEFPPMTQEPFSKFVVRTIDEAKDIFEGTKPVG
jgi:hypothetical protein